MIAASRIALILFPLLAGAESAHAASAVCERLEARLAGLPKVVSNAEPVAVTDMAGGLSRLNLDLRSARIELRRLGCSSGSIIVVGGPNEEACAALEGRVAGLEAELGALKERRRAANGMDTEATRAIIQSALLSNGCNETQADVIEASSTGATEPRNILKDLPEIDENVPFIGGEGSSVLTIPGSRRGPYRTMCVRTCDGAFFPITSDATPEDFPRDAAACSARCPGAETELYYHNLTTEESDQMVSATTGAPYSDLPNAFAYRTRDRAGAAQCGCQLPKTATLSGEPEDGAAQPSKAETSKVQTSKPLPALAETPLRATTQYERPYDPKNTRVRVVGPTFLPSEESRIDLKNPAGPGYQPVQN
ncbi:DUF2865 domain-containing protein [Rhizobium sp. SG2393]|uniref:DUF2865 domain-containing protein n=1 Tax=Rhizobium sp. SG2393 TaxID=3276279 RepID=UPI0036714A71